jgi:hypothetical protein
MKDQKILGWPEHILTLFNVIVMLLLNKKTGYGGLAFDRDCTDDDLQPQISFVHVIDSSIKDIL